MTIVTTYRVNEPTTLAGHSITISQTYSSFNVFEIDALQEKCKKMVAAGCMYEEKENEINSSSTNN